MGTYFLHSANIFSWRKNRCCRTNEYDHHIIIRKNASHIAQFRGNNRAAKWLKITRFSCTLQIACCKLCGSIHTIPLFAHFQRVNPLRISKIASSLRVRFMQSKPKKMPFHAEQRKTKYIRIGAFADGSCIFCCDLVTFDTEWGKK